MPAEDTDDWRWWRQVLVRGSGFPARGVLRLASEELAHKADSLVNADRRSEVWRAFCEEFHETTVDLAVELQILGYYEHLRTDHGAAPKVANSNY